MTHRSGGLVGSQWGGKEKKIGKKMLIVVISRSSNVVQDQLCIGYQDSFGNFELQQPEVQEDLGR